MDVILLFLAEKGALERPLQITTKTIGEAFSMSQQNASVRLRKLEEKNLIKKTPLGIKITSKGRGELQALSTKLKKLFSKKHFGFSGRIVRGLEQGKYFVSLPKYQKGFKELLGFTPHPGTINIELDDSQLESRVSLREHKALILPGFKQKGKAFGPVEIYPCNIEGYQGAIIFPFRTHHGLRILELISPHDLSKKLDISPGSTLRVEVTFD